jgi:predicted transcriptional regulator
MKVVGEVEIIDIIEENPKILWELTKEESGTTKEFYDKYFKNCDKAIAYKLGKVTKYNKTKELKEFGINKAPQSFIYLDI